MPTYKDKSFVEQKALEAASSKKPPLSGENNILTDFEEEVRKTYKKNSKKLEKLTKDAKNLHSKMLAPTIEGSEKTDMQNVLENYKLLRQEKYNQKKDLIKEKKYVENKIGNSSAEEISGNSSPYMWMWIIIALIMIAESVMNGWLLIEASSRGLIGGFLNAILIAFVSVAASIYFGKGFKHFFYTKYSEKPYKKIIAGAIGSLWVISAILYHSSVGWYRLALQTNVETAHTEWFNLFLNNGFIQHDIWSGVLVGVGIIAACSTFYQGYKWSENALLFKLRNIDNKIKKMDKSILELKKRAINKIKNQKIDASNKVKKATFSFENKKFEIAELTDIMNKYVLDQNTNIRMTVGVWRDSYKRRKPHYNFPNEITQINPEKYALDNIPGIQWINSVNKKESSIEKIREDRLREITTTFNTMFSHVNEITDPEEIDQDLLLLPLPERNNNE